MKLFGLCVGLAALVSEPAAAQLMSSSQEFTVFYQSHGSTGPQQIQLYDGPYVLQNVVITWSGGVGSYFDSPYSTGGTPYTQKYSGIVGFYMFNLDSGSPAQGADAFRSFSGSTTCTEYACLVEGSASGTLFGSPAAFQGPGTLMVDSGSYIDPDFGLRGPESGSGESVQGTITYYFGGVPEPATWGLMLGGFGAIGGAMRSRRKAAVSFA